MTRSRLIVVVVLAVMGCLAIDSLWAPRSLWAQRTGRRGTQQPDPNQTDPNQTPNQDPNQKGEDEKEPEAKLPDDPKLLQVYEQFVLNAEKLAADYVKNDQLDKARAVYEEIVRLVPSYEKGKKGLEDIKQRQATFMRANVSIYANKGWQDSGIVVAEGKPYQIYATGKWNFRLSHELSADGMEVPKELRDFNPGSLVGKIDDGDPKGGKPFFVGSSYSDTPKKTGKLLLCMYDADPSDNVGEMKVVITGSFAAGGQRAGLAGGANGNGK
jgi:hypothetical protein